MNKLNSIETQSSLDAVPLSNQTKFRLNEINKIKDYSNSKIQERKTSIILVFSLTTGIIKKLLKITRKKKKKTIKLLCLLKPN